MRKKMNNQTKPRQNSAINTSIFIGSINFDGLAKKLYKIHDFGSIFSIVLWTELTKGITLKDENKAERNECADSALKSVRQRTIPNVSDLLCLLAYECLQRGLLASWAPTKALLLLPLQGHLQHRNERKQNTRTRRLALPALRAWDSGHIQRKEENANQSKQWRPDSSLE